MKRPPANLLDRAIATVSPRWALNRAKDRALLALSGGYFGGSRRGRPALANWNPGASDADGDISPDLVDLRAYSRDLARRSPLAGGAISTVVTNTVGTGLSCQPAPDAAFLGLSDDDLAAWTENTVREFRLWFESTDCDLTRTQNGYGLQALAFRSALESGDVFALPTMAGQGRPYRLAVQLIEADRACNPSWKADTDTLVQGVESDGNGAPLAYYFANRHPGARARAGMQWTRVPAFGETSGRRNVLHLMDRRRPGQTRGVPYLAPVIEPLKQLTRYSEAEISAAVISAAFAVFVKMDADAFSSLFEGDSAKKYIDSAIGWNGSVPTADMDAPGKAVNLLPGEDIVAPDLKRPNTAFDPFVQAVLRQIGVGLELPFEVLIKHFTASYSAARAALLDAWRFFRGRRDWLASVFCQPLYELWLEEAVALGRVRAPGFFADPAWRQAWSAAVWIGDGPGSIDPFKEVAAAKERIAQGISTIAAESILHDGVDWTVKHRQRAREVALRREAGLEGQGAAPASAADPAQLSGNAVEERAGQLSLRNATEDAGIFAASGETPFETPLADARLTAMLEPLTAMAGSIAALATREPPAPHIEFRAGDTHVAAPEIHNHVAAPPAPVVQQDIHVQPAAAPVVENRVDIQLPEAGEKSDGVQKMEIVAMPGMRIEALPTRETESTVKRDADGNIVRTTQTEKDA